MQASSSQVFNGLAPTRIAQGMACFAWNKDQSKFAMCPNSSEIWIFKTNNAPNDSTKWERIQVLKEVKRVWVIIISLAFESSVLTRLERQDRASIERFHRPWSDNLGGKRSY